MLIKLENLLSLKQYLFILLSIFIIVISFNYYTNVKKLKKLENERDISMMNERAVKKSNRVLQLNIDDLKTSNDNKDKLVDSCLKVSKIKHKSVIETIIIKDTIYNTDTFKLDLSKDIDTIIGNKFLSNRLILRHPNYVSINTSISNEKVVIINREREIKGIPSKFWLFRLFQKKIDFLNINIQNTNPYIKEEYNKIIRYDIN